MTNFLEFDRSDMLTKMVEFSLHMTNFLEFDGSDMLPRMVEISLHMTKFFRNLIDLTC